MGDGPRAVNAIDSAGLPPGGGVVTVRFWLLVILLAALVAGGVLVVPRLEGTPPRIGELAALELGREPQPLVVEVSDEDSGLRTVELRVLSAGGSKTVMERSFPGDFKSGGETRDETLEVTLDAASLGLPDGEATLVVVARDWSLRDGLAGNASERSIPLTIDTVPPKLSVDSGLTYVYRGGSGAVVYRVDRDAAIHGVRVGTSFFAGQALAAGAVPAGQKGKTGAAPDPATSVAIFAIPVEAPADADVKVVARDAAGNESSAGFALRIVDRQWSESSLTLSQGFLEGTVRPLAEANGLAGRDLVESFQHVNEELRARNEERIRTIVADGSHVRYWRGAFEQLKNSKVTSRFAERRTYFWQGSPVSKAIHYGFDLASTGGANVTSSNDGVVAFAGDLGIYGNCVIVDHGLGVHTLYGHLSRLDVAEGDRVSKGQSLGRSGSTGLAGGDHLHFAMLVGGEYVDPLEWWDPKWVRSHIEWRLAPEPPRE